MTCTCMKNSGVWSLKDKLFPHLHVYVVLDSTHVHMYILVMYQIGNTLSAIYFYN